MRKPGAARTGRMRVVKRLVSKNKLKRKQKTSVLSKTRQNKILIDGREAPMISSRSCRAAFSRLGGRMAAAKTQNLHRVHLKQKRGSVGFIYTQRTLYPPISRTPHAPQEHTQHIQYIGGSRAGSRRRGRRSARCDRSCAGRA